MEKQEHAADDLDAKARALLPMLSDEDREALAAAHNGYWMGFDASRRIARLGLGLIANIETCERTDLGRAVARLLSEGAQKAGA